MGTHPRFVRAGVLPVSWLLAAAVLLAAGAALAAGGGPDAAVRATTEQLQAAIRAQGDDFRRDSSRFYAMVDQVVVPRFDTDTIGRQVLGRHWKDAAPAQRERFVQAFKNALVHSYADALLKYADAVKTNWKPLRGGPDGDAAGEATVHVDLVRKDAPPIPIGFSMHKVGGDWKVFDVSIEGVSLAATFRGQFNAEIKQKGLDSLISRLERGGKPLPAAAEEALGG